MEASRNTDEHRFAGRADTKKKPTTHGLGPRDHEARPHSVLVPSVSTLTRDTAASAPSLKRTTLLDLYVSSLRRGHANLLCIVLQEIHKLCVSSLRQGRAIFTVLKRVKKLQERGAPLVLLHRSKKTTNTYILKLCVSSLHRGHAQCFKFSSRKPKKGPLKAE